MDAIEPGQAVVHPPDAGGPAPPPPAFRRPVRPQPPHDHARSTKPRPSRVAPGTGADVHVQYGRGGRGQHVQNIGVEALEGDRLVLARELHSTPVIGLDGIFSQSGGERAGL